VVEQSGREVEWINRYLDQQRIRGVADSSLRSYAHDLLHFLRWWAAAHKTSTITKEALTESTLLDYIRFQVNQNPAPAAESVNRRVGTAERAMRCEFPEAAHLFAPGFQHWYWRQSRLGYGRLRPALTQLRVKTPKRVVVPLTVEEVARFWSSFRTSRDLAIVGLMLLHGLRSCEVLSLNREDVQLPDSQIRVQGKGKRIRTPTGSRIRGTARSLYVSGTPSRLRGSIRLSQRASPRHPDDTGRSAFVVSSSPANHERDKGEPAPVPPHLRFRHDPGRH
jgi:integrase